MREAGAGLTALDSLAFGAPVLGSAGFELSFNHHAGSRKTENNIFAPMPTAQTLPRLAMPGLLERPSEPKPAIAVPPQSNNARPIERLTVAASPP